MNYPLCLTKTEVELAAKTKKFTLPYPHVFFTNKDKNNILSGDKRKLPSGINCSVIGIWQSKRVGFHNLQRILLVFEDKGDIMYSWY